MKKKTSAKQEQLSLEQQLMVENDLNEINEIVELFNINLQKRI